MVDTQHFCLRWNNYQSSITSAFENLRDDEDFVDVTLACDGRSLKAHRVVLSACSPYFRELLKVSVSLFFFCVLTVALHADVICLAREKKEEKFLTRKVAQTSVALVGAVTYSRCEYSVCLALEMWSSIENAP